MSGGELEWMRNYQASENSRTPSKRIRVGVSEVFFGERGRELPFLQSAARLIEKLGFDEMWLPEHVVFFQSYESKYPYGDVGAREVHQTRQEKGNPGVRGIMDGPMIAVAAAAVTTKLRFGTFISSLPQRNPVVFAREIATVDHLTSGRFDLGVGVGWAREEYEACGVPFEGRGDRMDDYLGAMKSLWTTEVSEYASKTVSFGPLLAYPKPVQTPHPPLLIGGNSIRGIHRAAELGNGLIVYDLDISDLEKILDVYEKKLVECGRNLSDMRVVVGRRNEGRSQESWETDRSYIEQCRMLGGITDVVCSPRFGNEGYEEQMTGYAKAVIA